MEAVESVGSTIAAAGRPGGASAYAAILASGAVLWWLSAAHPALMPFWAPWEFSPTVYGATALALLWFGRGLALMPAAERPPMRCRIFYVVGVGLVYAVLQTRFEYWSLHMFFLNRIQHVVMHHIGPFLIALGAAGGTVRYGMPDRLRRVLGHPVVAAAMRVVQQPLVAAFLFVGLVFFWLIPPVHFRAMLDPRLYAVMNWSMVADGVLFWWLVLDPRPKPPARISFGARAALSFGVMFPQIALGAVIALSRTDLYPYYDLCGRLLPSIDAIADQHIGGIVIWIPPAMMSVLGMLVVIGALRRYEDAAIETSNEGAALAERAKSWTGR
ncbi:MAG TPA: cytochrome c oxidase assembly protein [Stellaceae bacterium]|nr:cytochrome c oxidase assembly protein [Stellaceae bacterium]